MHATLDNRVFDAKQFGDARLHEMIPVFLEKPGFKGEIVRERLEISIFREIILYFDLILYRRRLQRAVKCLLRWRKYSEG